jgi:HEAT repeat protein
MRLDVYFGKRRSDMRQKTYILLFVWVILACHWCLAQNEDDWSSDNSNDNGPEIRVQKWVGQEEEVEKWIRALDDNDFGVSYRAAIQLCEIAQDAPLAVVHRIVLALVQIPERRDFFALTPYLVNLKEKAAPAAPILVQWLSDPERDALHKWAAEILIGIGEPVEPYLPQLLRTYNKSALSVANALVTKLGPKAMPELIKVLQERDSWHRQYTLEILDVNLEKMGDAIQAAIPWVVNTERDNCYTIGIPYRLAKVCLPALAGLLVHEDEAVRKRVIRICRDLQYESILPLLEALAHDDPRVRAKVTELLINYDYEYHRYNSWRLIYIKLDDAIKRKAALQNALRHKDLSRKLRSDIEEILWSIGILEKEHQKAK